MAYIRIDFYKNTFGEISETDFNRLSWEACRLLDSHTTGYDGVKKLKVAFPTDEDSAEAVKMCAGKVVSILHQIQQAEAAAALANGYTETAQGLQRKIISRIEAGNEAISYSETKNTSTAIDAAVSDKEARDKLISDTIREYLSGVSDANGVNLLFMGRYPRV